MAIAAAMLVGLGFSPFRASAACLLANTAPGAFGSIGIPVITLAGTTGLPLNALSAAAGKLCAPINALLPVYLLLALGGPGALSGLWIPAMITGGTFALVQFLVSSYIGPQLTDLLASIAAMAAVVVISQVWKPVEYEAHWNLRGGPSDTSAHESQAKVAPSTRPSSRLIFRAWLPYCLLVVCILLWGLKPVQAILNLGTVIIPWPILHNAVLRMPQIVSKPSPYAAIFSLNVLSASGTSCMAAALLSALFAGMSTMKFLRLLGSVAHQLLLPTITFTSVLAAAFLMNYSGSTSTLGLAFAHWRCLPFFQRSPRMVGRLSYRFRYVFERSLWQSAGCNRK